jgi:hypothetical protein
LLLTGSSLIAIFNAVVLSHFEGKKGSGKINAIHPNDQIEAIDNNFNMLTDAQSRSPSVSPKNTFRVIILNRLLYYISRPLQVFDWIMLLVSFIINLYAHIELGLVSQEDTCTAPVS